MADWTSSEAWKVTPFGVMLNRAPRGSSHGQLRESLALPLGT